MKTTIVKMILPVAAFVLASAGAVGTAKTDSKGALAPLAGYRLTGNPLQPCSYVKMCADTGGQICTVDGTPFTQQLWHQPNVNVACNITVFEP
ncbi:DUF6520 family protein [Flavobacterium sp.]|uniref:DUF6520 family protein n=1 Tax=Flavobacterium sp. TaxID=239 RepID=UPI00122C01C4|nr:DUF6520 family protein [Flavobacterium sp.]RZJ71734.1 MAG: hypothetical protein EOO49_08705 [Flavobacterium sp.]